VAIRPTSDDDEERDGLDGRITMTRTSTTARPIGVLALALVAAALAAPATARGTDRTVVVTGAGDAVRAVEHAGGTVLRRLPLVHGVVARLAAPTLPGFTVTPDRAMTVSGRPGTTGGTETTVRAALGLGAPTDQGAGITVAVVDTGVADVPELAGRVSHVDVTGDGTGDGYGHGTFVAGVVAGATLGVAPGANVLDVRVGHNDGSTSLVDVMAGLQVVSEHPEATVVNLSLSADGAVPPLTEALDTLWAMGHTVVVPAGNEGPNDDTITTPGTDSMLLTVGALDGSAVADWSSRGGHGIEKPDLVAPGAHLVSAGDPGSVIWNAHPSAQRVGALFVGSGTSFSTAAVSGAAAVLLSDRAQLFPDQVKALVRHTADTVPGPRSAAGSGALDVAAAAARQVPGGGANSSSDDFSVGPDASSWSVSSWGASSWSARQWSARQWSARQWSAEEWAARQWSARQWSARQWSTDDWSARQWSARQWSARQWSTEDWSARQWTARQWSASSWE
jgi:serine protease AprX